MEVVAKCDSKRMYSWWWDSHNTPKNSKWLQDNLADMDSNVKKMIKVLEEDADSFARRAEMYYRKRPELMKLVEEFYRAYRALAERYNHATGVIHKAHETIAEAFPNQVPLIFGDDSHVGALTNDADPQTPDMLRLFRARDELQKDSLGFSFSNGHAVKRNIDFSEEPLFASNGKARKGLNFNDGVGTVRNDLKAKILSESERASKAEAEIVALKDSLTKMQAEKEASLAQFEKSLETLSNLESEASHAQEVSRELDDRAASAEAEIQTLRETIEKLESEKESSLLQYQQCLQKIADLEDGISVAHKDVGEINDRASKAEAETLTLKQSLAKAETDKEAALVQYNQCVTRISNLEERLQKSEEEVTLINEQAEKARLEVESLKQTISKLAEDKEASELQYQQCLNITADLKLKLYHAQEETQRLRCEIEDGMAKLKFSEEKSLVLERSNLNLHSELDGLLEKLGNQGQKLTEKQTEVVKLWSCVQEEHLHFQEAETAFQTLLQLHSQSQEELNNLTVELQAKSQIMKDMEIQNEELHEEIQQAKFENQGLSELNLSSVASIKSLREDVSSLKETIQKLEAEVEVRVDQRNNLQQEIYCLKEEVSRVKDLQEENSTLKECNEIERNEKMALLEKLETMEKLVQKNLMLEKSISDLNIELDSIKEKMKTLKEAVRSLSEEKSGLVYENQHTAIENFVIVEFLQQLNSEATYELAEAYKYHESERASNENLKRSQAIFSLNESIKSLEEDVSVHRESQNQVSKGVDSMDAFTELEDMCLRIKAIREAIKEKEKFMTLENSNAYSMLEAAVKQVKGLNTGSGRSTRKHEGRNGRTRNPSQEIEMVMKDIVLDQTSDASSYEIISKKGLLELDDDHSFVELRPVKTHKPGKSLSEESLVVDKLEIFDGFMDPTIEVNKKKVLEKLDSDLQKLENLQITVGDLNSKVKTEKAGGEEYETIKGQLEEVEEAIEKLFNVNRKLTSKAQSEKDCNRRRRITEHARRGAEKIGRLQLEIQRIQFLLMKMEGEKENRARSKISDTNSTVLLRDYIYGRPRSISMKKTKKRAAFCGCVQPPRSP